MNRIAGGLLVVAGAYVAYYGWYEIRVLNGATGDPIIDRGIEIQRWLQNTVVPDDPMSFTIQAVIVLALLAAGTSFVRRLRDAQDDATTSAAPSVERELHGADGGAPATDDASVEGATSRG
jgi:hypothetical protein